METAKFLLRLPSDLRSLLFLPRTTISSSSSRYHSSSSDPFFFPAPFLPSSSLSTSPEHRTLNMPPRRSGATVPSLLPSGHPSFAAENLMGNVVQNAVDSAKARNERERGLSPAPMPPLPSAGELIASATMQRVMALQNQSSNELNASITYCGDEKHHSEVDLGDLKRIELKDMKIRQVHRGRYLLCRVVAQPSPSISIDLHVLDPSGTGIQLFVYNFPLLPLSLGPPTIQDIDAIFPLGTILAIREPWCKMPLGGSSTPMLRVDSPSDVVFVSEGDKLLEGVKWREVYSGFWKVPVMKSMSLEEWKALGNKETAARRYIGAVKAYSFGISQHSSHPDVHLLHLNRSHVYLLLERFPLALLDANKTLKLLNSIPTSSSTPATTSILEKAHFRRCKALYSLRRWWNAEDAFSTFLSLFPNSKEASIGLASSRTRLGESETGDYDFVNLFDAGQKTSTPRMDVAEFIGPVEVVRVEGKGGGRGTITTRNVKAGELLLGTKALQVVFQKEVPPGIVFSYNLLRGGVDSTTETTLRSSLIYKLYHQPDLVDRVHALYAGPTLPPPPSTYELLPPVPTEPGTSVRSLNVAAIEGAVAFNAFGVATVRRVGFVPSEGAGAAAAALFGASSLLNHSCVPNCAWVSFGDFQTIRALEDLPKGTEVFISYATPGAGLAGRQESLKKFLGSDASCGCEMCVQDRSDGASNVKLRAKLGDRIVEYAGKVKITEDSSVVELRSFIKDLDPLLAKLRSTYSSSRTSPRPELFVPYQRLAFAQGAIAAQTPGGRGYKDVKPTHILALESVGAVVRPDSKTGLPISRGPQLLQQLAVCSAIQLVLASECLGDEEGAKGWMRAARWMDGRVVGGGKELFKERFGSMLDGLALWKYV